MTDDTGVGPAPPETVVLWVKLLANPGPEVVTTKSPAPPVVVECWISMVADMDRVRLDRFTRETWKKFDAKDLEPLKWAILRRRRVLAAPMRP